MACGTYACFQRFAFTPTQNHFLFFNCRCQHEPSTEHITYPWLRKKSALVVPRQPYTCRSLLNINLYYRRNEETVTVPFKTRKRYTERLPSSQSDASRASILTQPLRRQKSVQFHSSRTLFLTVAKTFVLSAHACRIWFVTHWQAQLLLEETKMLTVFLALFQPCRFQELGDGEGRTKKTLFTFATLSQFFIGWISATQGLFLLKSENTDCTAKVSRKGSKEHSHTVTLRQSDIYCLKEMGLKHAGCTSKYTTVSPSLSFFCHPSVTS